MSANVPAADPSASVLIFAPVGRDAELTQHLLERASIASAICQSMADLCERFTLHGGGALLLTEEALDDRELSTLAEVLDRQAAWSDVPVLLFAGGFGVDMSLRTIGSIETLRNVTLIERPIRVAAVLSTIRAALRGRMRQYEVRDLLLALHRARSDAESANRLKDEFLATLSHELRTPLNAILGWTSMLARGQIEPRRLPRVFDALNRNAESQAQLIADVLDVSRIITGKLQLQLATVNICDALVRAIDAVRPAAAAKNISLSADERDDCFVRGDSDRLQQVFWNLLSNAVKFTPQGGTVRVEIARDGTYLTVAVIDTGPGISSAFAPFLFDRFRQADQTTTREHGGLGLGLSIVKHLTELHGGTVTAESDGPGCGACFRVRLPAAQHPAAAGTSQNARDDRHVHLGGVAILVVDDDESNRDVVAAALEAAHARVQLASSALEARRYLEESTPDLIIADLGMPVEDGFTFMRGVRRSPARHVPAIALSAYADATSRQTALAAGFTAFVAKPTRPQALIELVGSLLGAMPTQD